MRRSMRKPGQDRHVDDVGKAKGRVTGLFHVRVWLDQRGRDSTRPVATSTW